MYLAFHYQIDALGQDFCWSATDLGHSKTSGGSVCHKDLERKEGKPKLCMGQSYSLFVLLISHSVSFLLVAIMKGSNRCLNWCLSSSPPGAWVKWELKIQLQTSICHAERRHKGGGKTLSCVLIHRAPTQHSHWVGPVQMITTKCVYLE